MNPETKALLRRAAEDVRQAAALEGRESDLGFRLTYRLLGDLFSDRDDLEFSKELMVEILDKTKEKT